mgnify:CR=1 FL=1
MNVIIIGIIAVLLAWYLEHQFLGIKSADKKSLTRVAVRDGYEIQFDHD